MTQASNLFLPEGEEKAFYSSEVKDNPLSQSLWSAELASGCGVKDCAILDSTSCSPQKESRTSSSHSQTQTSSSHSQTQTRSTSCEFKNDEDSLANKKWNSADTAANSERTSNNGSARKNGGSFPCSLQSETSMNQQHSYNVAMLSDPTSHNVKFSSRDISGAHSFSHNSVLSQHQAMQEDQSRNDVLNQGIFPCLSATQKRGEIHPTAVDIFSDVSTGLADSTESENIIFNGCA